MARTLIGRLQLVVQAMGLKEAKKVEGTISSIEKAANRLTTAKWGQGFQRQIEKMALSAKDLDTVRRSWDRLQNDMATRGLSKALQKSEISGWKTATIGNLAAVRSQMQSTEKYAHRLGKTLRNSLRPVYVAAGGYTLTYLTGILGREAFTAASESQRVQAEAKFAGLSKGEQGSIKSRAGQLAEQYRLSFSEVFDMLKETTLSMPNVEAALKVSDANARAMLVFNNSLGSGAGVSGVRAFAKSMDLLERLDPNQYTKMLDGFVKMQQILGRDIDPDAYFQAVKYSRAGGKVGSDEFISTYLPMLIAETGGPNAGNSIRAGFDQFVIGRASKKALAAQRSFGLRDKNNALIGEKEFGENPIKWVYDTLIPALKQKGVDTGNKVELARVVGQLSSNRLSSDEIIGAILNMQQVFRYLEKRVPNAAGLSAADDVQKLNPFAAFAGFKDSLKNLSSAVVPMDNIGAGLNRFADYINAFTKKVQEGDSAVIGFSGATAAGVGAFGLYKVGAGIYGLITAGTQLNIAAAALQAAAVAQGGGAAGGVAAGLAGKGFFKTLLTTPWGIAALLAGGGIYKFIADTTASNAKDSKAPPPKYYSQGDTQDRDNYHRLYGGMQFEGGWHRVGMGAAPAPGVDAAKQAGEDIKSALSPVGKPTVDVSALQQAVGLAREFLTLMNRATSTSSNASSAVDAQMRRSHSDFGIAP